MNQRGRLDGQVAFVTAGGGGIGRAIALGLAEAGADVAVFEIVPERAEETAARIRELGREALAIPGDAMEAEAIRAAIAATDARFGRL
ncbi:MAG: SDR family NAD(P)-dependent oxidoreductase, partial [Gammaproteobacteria bacterium]